MEQHIARRTTASARSSSASPPQSHRQSRHQQPQRHSSSTASGRRESKHPESGPKTKTKTGSRPISTQQLAPAPVVTNSERAIGKGASLPVVDEKGQVWYDWEEKQEFTPLITVEHERSGWVNFPGGAAGRSNSSGGSSSHTDDEGSDEGLCDSTSASPVQPLFPLPLHAVLDAFTFAGGNSDGGSAPGATTVDPKDPMHGLRVPPGARPRGKDRRIVRRVDSLPSLPDQAERKEAAAREFFDGSFNPAKAMRAMQLEQQQQSQQPPQQRQQPQRHATAPAVEALVVQNKQLAFGKRASMSIKKIFSRKKSTA